MNHKILTCHKHGMQRIYHCLIGTKSILSCCESVSMVFWVLLFCNFNSFNAYDLWVQSTHTTPNDLFVSRLRTIMSYHYLYFEFGVIAIAFISKMKFGN